MRTVDITFVLDRSGSMESVRASTVSGFNSFIEEQKKVPGEAVVTLAQFDDVYEIVYDAVPIAQVRPLTHDTFVPRGSTALLDAIGRTLNATQQRLTTYNEQKQVIFVIVTDGQENASTEFRHPQIQQMIKQARDERKWEFVYLGANQDAISVAKAMNIPVGNAMNFQATPGKVAGAYLHISRAMLDYRVSMTPQTTCFFSGDTTDPKETE